MIEFSHLYIEEEAYQYPITFHVLEKFPNAIKIDIKNYKHVFNRPNQDFQAQKESAKLLLAVRKENFYFKKQPELSQSTTGNFYYNTLILNCIYNCEYCYLQGMFHSGNIVIFVNIEDFFRETEKLLADTSIYLSISQETDILAFETIVPYARYWIEFARTHTNLTIEMQTKSDQYKLIQNSKSSPNVILSWTISPEELIQKYEKNSPSLALRLKDIQSAMDDGWNVRICIDPILRVKNWQEVYSRFLKEVFSTIRAEKVFDVKLGTLRLNADYLKKMKKVQSNSDILHYPFDRVGNIYTYPEKKENEMIEFLYRLSKKYCH